MIEESILTTISQETGKFKDIISSVYGAVSPLNFQYALDFTMATFCFSYLSAVQRTYYYSTEKLVGQDLNSIFSTGILDLIEFLESHINDETSIDDFQSNSYCDTIDVLEKNLNLYPTVFLEYETISGCLTASDRRIVVAHCNNPTNLNRLPYEMQVQVLYESMIQAMIEPLKKIYDKLCM